MRYQLSIDCECLQRSNARVSTYAPWAQHLALDYGGLGRLAVQPGVGDPVPALRCVASILDRAAHELFWYFHFSICPY